jgi:hypothetical protein
MRLRLVVLPVMALIGLIPAARAGALDQARLRGTSADYGAPDASYPIIPTEPSYPSPSYPGPPPAPSYPAASAPSRSVAVAPPVAQLHNFTFEIGTRYWYSTGQLAKDLFDDPRSSQNLNSRLTYSGLTSGTFEGFGRANTSFGSFFKGYAGFSGLNSGTLNDEDFPPGIAPYSNTVSQQQGGQLAYGTVDFGQIVVKNQRVSVSLFAGYGYLNESVNAFGCTQIAGNQRVCVPAINSGVLGITEESRWQFARAGILGEFKLLDRLTLSAEVAWLPYEQVTAQDTHWLRLGTSLLSISGPIPESGSGAGVQIEAIMSYRVSDKVTFGLGGRYWYLQTHGGADFESVIVGFPFGPVAQPLNFTTTRYGGFAQGAYKFGPL